MGKVKVKTKKRATTQLRTVIGTDLLTLRESWVKGNVGGFYSITDEQAYFKVENDKSQMTVSEFQKHLRDNIDPLFTVVFNPTLTKNHACEGHSIYFNIPQWDAFIPVCKVGHSANNVIPAESQGYIADYRGKSFYESGIMDQEPILYRGWVAAFEACKLAYQSWERDGIEPSRALTAKEVMGLKKIYSIVGNGSMLEDYVKRMSVEKMINEVANDTKNIELLKATDTLKFINKLDENVNIFITQSELDALDGYKRKEFYDTWRELTPEEVTEKITTLEASKSQAQEELKEEKLESTNA
jgi:hypothetical protein